jgi:hypothetical protein
MGEDEAALWKLVPELSCEINKPLLDINSELKTRIRFARIITSALPSPALIALKSYSRRVY